MIRQVLSLPERMVERRVDRRGLKWELALLFVLGGLGSAGFGYFSWKVMSTAESYVQPAYTNFTMFGLTVESLGFLFITWLGFAVISHFIANMWGGRGPVIRLLRTSAWSLIPFGIWLILRTAVVAVLTFLEDLPETPEIEAVGPQAFMNYYLDLILEDPIYVVTMLVGLVFVYWSWQLLTVAVSEAKQIETDRARRVAAIPAGLLGLYLVYLTFGWQTIV